MGWRFEGTIGDAPRHVLAVAPHTSNWDFIVGFSAYLALELEATWFGKHTLFRWPMGPLLRYFGGIPVERGRAGNVVDLYVAEFRRRDRMLLALAPEGTRKYVAGWKSGFYHIAVGAGAVITPVALDYSTRTVRIYPSVTPTGDMQADVSRIRGLYHAGMARFPTQFQGEGAFAATPE